MKRKTLTLQEYQLPITLKEDSDGTFLAFCPNWNDCYAQGNTIEEAINEITYVASSLIELYREEEIPVPLELKKSTKKGAIPFTINFPLIVSTT